jgi:hypothetical protein
MVPCGAFDPSVHTTGEALRLETLEAVQISMQKDAAAILAEFRQEQTACRIDPAYPDPG